MSAARLLMLCFCLGITSAARAQVVVPPYPPPAPEVFPSAAAYADYGVARLAQLTARERGLIRLGRPVNYGLQLGGGFALMGIGSGAVAIGAFFGLFSLASDTGDQSASQVFFGVAGLGGAMMVGGLVWLVHLWNSNPYRDEIRDLHTERGQLKHNIKRARRDASFELSLGNGVQVRF